MKQLFIEVDNKHTVWGRFELIKPPPQHAPDHPIQLGGNSLSIKVAGFAFLGVIDRFDFSHTPSPVKCSSDGT